MVKIPKREVRVESVPLDALKPYDGNAKRHTREQIDAVEASIREFGFRNPILAWHDEGGAAEIVAGHARATAARNLGMDLVPVIFVDDLSDAQRRALTLADNQTTMMTGWDEDMLAYELDVLSQDFDMGDFGFTDEMLGMAEDAAEAEDVEVPETIQCRCKRGDIWMLGAHRIVCGDATSGADLQKLTRGGVAQLLLTDPPYGVSYVGKTKDAMTIENDALDDSGLHEFLVDSLSNACSAMEPGSAFYVFHADSKGGVFRNALSDSGMTVRECLVWVKNSMVLGRQDYQWRHEPCLYGWKDGAAHHWYSDRKQTTVLEFDRPTANREHPTMKPVPLLAYLISNSTRKGDTVLDVFGGSGSTLMACEQLGRSCWTMELDPHYCDVIIQRWEDSTGRKAVRLDHAGEVDAPSPEAA